MDPLEIQPMTVVALFQAMGSSHDFGVLLRSP